MVIMEVRQLEQFVAVAEERSFTRAARRVNIVQSGLSMAIRNLEREVGAALFVRGPKRLSLTPAGRAFLPAARRALTAVRDAREAVVGTERLLRGTLSIGSAPALPAAVDLPVILARFRSEYPNVSLRVRQGSAPEVMEAVRSGILDVGFIAWTGPAPPGVTAVPIARSSMALVCATSHRLATRRRVNVAELRDERFIDCHRDWTIRHLADRILAAAGIERVPSVVVNDVPFLLGFVEQGLGVALVPRVFSRFPARVKYVSLSPKTPQWHLVAAFAGDRPSGAAARALLGMLPRPGAEAGGQIVG
jgi:DNA-binding transcriptional LysR family regulator